MYLQTNIKIELVMVHPQTPPPGERLCAQWRSLAQNLGRAKNIF
jgi:hypothetical protein